MNMHEVIIIFYVFAIDSDLNVYVHCIIRNVISINFMVYVMYSRRTVSSCSTIVLS